MIDSSSSYRPWSSKVKWSIAGGLVLSLGALQFVTYFLGKNDGYEEGYEEGKRYTPEYVIQQSDEKALSLLASFMADAAKSSESLAHLLQSRQERLDWVRDETLKLEVSWGLARELVQRGGFQLAQDSVLELLNQGLKEHPNKIWANRAYFISKEFQEKGNLDQAIQYLVQATQIYQKEGMIQEQIAMENMLASLLLIQGKEDLAMQTMDRVVKLCDRLPKNLMELEKPRMLAMQGRLARLSGKTSESRQHFKEALELSPDMAKYEQVEGLATACLGMGEAMLEAKKFNEANSLFLRTIKLSKQPGSKPKDSVNALRGLALIATINNDQASAQSYLDQAKGIALISIDENDAMWPNIYDQLAWISLGQQNHDLARQDFNRAIKHPATSPLVRTQSLEGLGQTEFETNQPKLAIDYLTQALTHRLESFQEDKLAIAQTAKKLGMAYDLLGQTTKANEAYELATQQILHSTNPVNQELKCSILLANAYSCMELKQWQKASDIFNQAIPLMEGERQSETYKQLGKCYDEQGMRDRGDECWRLSGFPRVKASSSKKK